KPTPVHFCGVACAALGLPLRSPKRVPRSMLVSTSGRFSSGSVVSPRSTSRSCSMLPRWDRFSVGSGTACSVLGGQPDVVARTRHTRRQLERVCCLAFHDQGAL